MYEKHILVLGVGNLLLGDEGAGVRVIEKLEDEYAFSNNVELYDGGTLGLRLLEPICQASIAIVVDSVLCGRRARHDIPHRGKGFFQRDPLTSLRSMN